MVNKYNITNHHISQQKCLRLPPNSTNSGSASAINLIANDMQRFDMCFSSAQRVVVGLPIYTLIILHFSLILPNIVYFIWIGFAGYLALILPFQLTMSRILRALNVIWPFFDSYTLLFFLNGGPKKRKNAYPARGHRNVCTSLSNRWSVFYRSKCTGGSPR